jgi:hypothetical protein
MNSPRCWLRRAVRSERGLLKLSAAANYSGRPRAAGSGCREAPQRSVTENAAGRIRYDAISLAEFQTVCARSGRAVDCRSLREVDAQVLRRLRIGKPGRQIDGKRS